MTARYLGALLLLVSQAAGASMVNGNKLMEFIGEGTGVAGSAYIIGVYDAYQHILFCVPPGVTGGQLRDVASAFIKGTPARRHEPAHDLITDAFMQHWPCPKQAPATPSKSY